VDLVDEIMKVWTVS